LLWNIAGKGHGHRLSIYIFKICCYVFICHSPIQLLTLCFYHEYRGEYREDWEWWYDSLAGCRVEWMVVGRLWVVRLVREVIRQIRCLLPKANHRETTTTPPLLPLAPEKPKNKRKKKRRKKKREEKNEKRKRKGE
jgi:hypothetical protein